MNPAAVLALLLTVALFATVLVLPAIGAFRHRGGRRCPIDPSKFTPEQRRLAEAVEEIRRRYADPLPTPTPPAPARTESTLSPYRHGRRFDL